VLFVLSATDLRGGYRDPRASQVAYPYPEGYVTIWLGAFSNPNRFSPTDVNIYIYCSFINVSGTFTDIAGNYKKIWPYEYFYKVMFNLLVSSEIPQNAGQPSRATVIQSKPLGSSLQVTQLKTTGPLKPALKSPRSPRVPVLTISKNLSKLMRSLAHHKVSDVMASFRHMTTEIDNDLTILCQLFCQTCISSTFIYRPI